MKSLILTAFAMLFSLSVFAEPVCDFPYDLSEDEGVQEVSWTGIDASSRLSALQKKQIIITAKRYAERAPRTMTLAMAIDLLSDNSEGGDLSYMVFRFKGKTYNLVQHYPGGNPYGLVFKGTEIVAERTDGDLNCTGF
jgi:hypothetical protein